MAKHWDDWRDTIISYYINDNLTLRDVMQIMRDRHGFIASQRSYRQKFKDWGIRKYRQHGETWSSPSGSPQSATRYDPPVYEQIASNPSTQTAPEPVYPTYSNVPHTTNQNGWPRNEAPRGHQSYQQSQPAWNHASAGYQYPVPQQTYTQPAQSQHSYHGYQPSTRPSQQYASHTQQQQHNPPYY
jgi:hypothetical protein